MSKHHILLGVAFFLCVGCGGSSGGPAAQAAKPPIVLGIDSVHAGAQIIGYDPSDGSHITYQGGILDGLLSVHERGNDFYFVQKKEFDLMLRQIDKKTGVVKSEHLFNAPYNSPAAPSPDGQELAILLNWPLLRIYSKDGSSRDIEIEGDPKLFVGLRWYEDVGIVFARRQVAQPDQLVSIDPNSGNATIRHVGLTEQTDVFSFTYCEANKRFYVLAPGRDSYYLLETKPGLLSGIIGSVPNSHSPVLVSVDPRGDRVYYSGDLNVDPQIIGFWDTASGESGSIDLDSLSDLYYLRIPAP